MGKPISGEPHYVVRQFYGGYWCEESLDGPFATEEEAKAFRREHHRKGMSAVTYRCTNVAAPKKKRMSDVAVLEIEAVAEALCRADPKTYDWDVYVQKWGADCKRLNIYRRMALAAISTLDVDARLAESRRAGYLLGRHISGEEIGEENGL